MAMERHGIKEKAQQTLSVVVREAVYHKLVPRNHHMQYANVQTQRKLTVSCRGCVYLVK